MDCRGELPRTEEGRECVWVLQELVEFATAPAAVLGKTKVLLLTGAAGSGKSALMKALDSQLAAAAGGAAASSPATGGGGGGVAVAFHMFRFGDAAADMRTCLRSLAWQLSQDPRLPPAGYRQELLDSLERSAAGGGAGAGGLGAGPPPRPASPQCFAAAWCQRALS